MWDAACGPVSDDYARTGAYICSLTVVVVCYVCLSVSLTELVKWLESYFDGGSFDYPILITGTVFVVQFALLSLGRAVPGCERCVGRFPPLQRITMIKLVIPLGLLISLHYSCDNLAVSKMSVTLATMLSSSSTMFVMSFSLLLGLERPSSLTCLIISIVTVGLLLVCANSIGDDVDVAGVVYAIMGATSLGLRWPLAQILLQVVRVEEFNLMFHYLPYSILLMTVAFAALEAKDLFTADLSKIDVGIACGAVAGISAGCVLLYYLELTACRLTSAISQQLITVVKQVVQIVVSVWIYGDTIKQTELYGFMLIMVGVLIYTIQRYLEIRSVGGIRQYNSIHKDRMVKRLQRLGILKGIHFAEPQSASSTEHGPMEQTSLLGEPDGSYQNGEASVDTL